MKAWKTILGACLFFLGFISMVLSLVGLRLSMLSFLYALGTPVTGIAILIMLFGGMILIYLDRIETDIPHSK